METASVGKRTKIDLNNYLSFPCNQIFEFEVRNLNIICIFPLQQNSFNFPPVKFSAYEIRVITNH